MKTKKVEEEIAAVEEEPHFSTNCPDGKPHMLWNNFYSGRRVEKGSPENEYIRDMYCRRCNYTSWDKLTEKEYVQLQSGRTPDVLLIKPKTPFKVNEAFKPLI